MQRIKTRKHLGQGLVSSLDHVVFGPICYTRCWVLCRDGSCGVLIRHVHGLLQGVLGEYWGSAAGSEPPRLHQGPPQSQAGTQITLQPVFQCHFDMIGALFW